MTASALPPEAYAVALTALPAMGPARLHALLRRWSPEAAWAAVLDGRAASEAAVAAACRPWPHEVGAAWRQAASQVAVGDRWWEHMERGLGVVLAGGPVFPAVLADDPEPPAVLFWQGDIEALEGPRVAIVGARRCTHYGREVARELGRELSSAGVVVVSGLALGVDGAAHAGALAVEGAPPVAVVGSGLDVIYPRQHRELWSAVADAGVVLSEGPLGTRPEAWRFPARNRIIAALATATIVVEAATKSGSLITADLATDLGRVVAAVPGPVTSRASAGANELLHAGAAVIRGPRDVLDLVLGADAPAVAEPEPPLPPLDPVQRRLLEAIERGRGTLAELATTMEEARAASGALSQLELLGLVRRGFGGRYVRCP